MAKQADPRLSLSTIFGHSQQATKAKQTDPRLSLSSIFSHSQQATKAKQADPRLSLSSIFGHSQQSAQAQEDIFSSNCRSQKSDEQTVIVAGNSIAGVLGSRYDLAAKHNINVDLQCWPNENLGTILNNLRSYIKPSHQVILLFGVTFEAWNYVPFIPDQAEPKVVLPNVNFDLKSVADKINSFVEFCKSINRSMKVILVIPSIHDMYQYNESRLKPYPPQYVKMLRSSPTFNKESMAQNSRLVYKKICALSKLRYNWHQKIILSCQKLLTNKGLACFKREVSVKVNNYILGESDFLAIPEALVNGLHPSEHFIRLFWKRYAHIFKKQRQGPMSTLPQPEKPPHLSQQDMSMNTSMEYKPQTEQERIRDERMRLLKEAMLLYEEKRKKEEKRKEEEESPVEKLLRERVKIQKEKQKLQREKQELFYLEQEYKRKKMFEREREALGDLQLNYEQLRLRAEQPFTLSSNNRPWNSYDQNTKRLVLNNSRFKWHSDRISNQSGVLRSNEPISWGCSQPMHPSSSPSAPPPSARESRPQYNSDSENTSTGYWRLGTLSHSSKNNSRANYESTSSDHNRKDESQNF